MQLTDGGTTESVVDVYPTGCYRRVGAALYRVAVKCILSTDPRPSQVHEQRPGLFS